MNRETAAPSIPFKEHLVSRARAAACFLNAGVILIGLLVLAGWVLDLEALKRIFPGLVAMNPLTAVCFILSGLAALFLFDEDRRLPMRTGQALALLVAAAGVLRLAQYAAKSGFTIDQFWFYGKLAGNVMAPNTAAGFLLTGLALLLTSRRDRRVPYVSQSLAIAAFLIALLALVGYGYQVQMFYKVSFYIPMALHTALAFALLSLGILNLRVRDGFMKIFVSDHAGGFIARRLLPAVVLVPALLGECAVLGARAGLYSTEFGLALLVVFSIVIFFMLVWAAARIIGATDRVRRQAEEALRKAHDELESRVRERTAALEAAQRQMVQQERLRALGEMASGIAHDFNNALSPIMGYVELMLDQPDILDEKAKCIEYLRAMNTSAGDASAVVRRLREFSRPREESEAFKAVDLNGLVKETVVLTQPKWKNQALARGADIEISMDLAAVPEIFASGTEIRELLTNLIFNAVDALPEGGSISIGTRAEDGRVLLEVADTGTGMPEEVRRRCLEPFFSTKGDKGTGLGLSMVYGILRRHEAAMEIRSAPGQGTVFTIAFAARKGEQGGAAETRTAAAACRKLRILYVEDEQAVREVFTRYLERDGHAVDAVGSGREALAKFERAAYDLVITDHAMPGMSGQEFASMLKRQAPAIPVVLLSGTAGFKIAADGAASIDAVLKKPVTLQEVRAVLAQLFPNG